MNQHLLSVVAVDLTAYEICDLRRHLGLPGTGTGKRMAGPPLTNVLLVRSLEISIKRQSTSSLTEWRSGWWSGLRSDPGTDGTLKSLSVDHQTINSNESLR